MENIKTNNAQIKYTKRTESDVKQNAKRNDAKWTWREIDKKKRSNNE